MTPQRRQRLLVLTFVGLVIAAAVVAAALLGPFLLWLLFPRAKRWDILWTEIMDPEEISRPPQAWMGVVLMWIGGLGALVVGLERIDFEKVE